MRASRHLSTTPLLGCQEHLLSPGTAGLDINVEDVWATNKGDGINVVVVDREIDSSHEDLHDNVNETLNHDYTEEDQDIFIRRTGHGTAVAGIIAARDNDLGVRGVAPRATIFGHNLLDNWDMNNWVDALVAKCGRYRRIQQQLRTTRLWTPYARVAAPGHRSGDRHHQGLRRQGRILHPRRRQ